MKVTCHLADNFYYSKQMAGAVSLELHGIKCPDERLDCVRLHLETPQFMSQSCPESHLWRLCYQHRVLITRRPLTETATGQIAWLWVFSHFVRLLQSINTFSWSPLFCFHTIFWCGEALPSSTCGKKLLNAHKNREQCLLYLISFANLFQRHFKSLFILNKWIFMNLE